ncbi:hypothetical protein RIF29_14368 [Crotalaria pallida]|uniref:Uncharacterized protein n=1 Tax=Crotalaria pallida TaxID=3830 RepID=A0AAN9FD71_CROPI
MARKRGRPPKTPSSSNNKSQEKQPLNDDGNFCVDLSLSDEETLGEIDNLSPKKAEILLRNLETLRVRIEGKQWVEKKRPTKEDIEKIDDALRAEDEEALENAVAVSNNVAAVNTPSKDTVVADSLSEPGEQDGGNSDAINRGTESKVNDNRGPATPEIQGREEDLEWTPVVTRSKVQAKAKQEKVPGKGVLFIQASKANG